MTHEPIRVAVLFSGSASSLRFLEANDPAYGKLYVIVGAISDNPDASGLAFAKDAGIPTAVFDFKKWCEENDVSPKDLAARAYYYHDMNEQTGVWRAECLFLFGFMLLMTDPFLSQYEGRMLNVHPADLSIVRDCTRVYKGLNVVARAMQAGDPTASTVHIVTKEKDGGPVVAISDPLPYSDDTDPGKHQEAMKTACDGPAYQAAIKKLIDAGWPRKAWHG